VPLTSEGMVLPCATDLSRDGVHHLLEGDAIGHGLPDLAEPVLLGQLFAPGSKRSDPGRHGQGCSGSPGGLQTPRDTWQKDRTGQRAACNRWWSMSRQDVTPGWHGGQGSLLLLYTMIASRKCTASSVILILCRGHCMQGCFPSTHRVRGEQMLRTLALLFVRASRVEASAERQRSQEARGECRHERRVEGAGECKGRPEQSTSTTVRSLIGSCHLQRLPAYIAWPHRCLGLSEADPSALDSFKGGLPALAAESSTLCPMRRKVLT